MGCGSETMGVENRCRLALVFFFCAVLGSTGTLRAAEDTVLPFVADADYDPAIPTPERIVGHAVAEKAVRYPALVAYLHALAEASNRVTLTSYGRTHEGRTLYYLTITDPANHERLDQIKADNARLADPRTLDDAEQGDRLVAELPAIAWMNYSIHGDELSSTDAAMFVAYHLAASRSDAERDLLRQVVVHLNPLVNPDGRERYLSHLQQLTGAVSSPDLQSMQHQALWSRGRGNHYLFDLNRDWLVHLQPEVAPLAQAILSWNPHLLVDSHEQGAYDTYLFDPPRDPINIHLSPKVLAWRTRFSADQAAAFNRHGWSYYTRDWYSEWSPIYTNAWASLQGAIGLLYEQARTDAASVKHPTGLEITYRETVHHHIVSSLANLQTLCVNRSEILSDFLRDRREAVAGETSGEAFLLPPASDAARWHRFVELLRLQGLDVGFARAAFPAYNVTDLWGQSYESRTLPAGTLVVRSNQPRERMLRALCEFDPHLTESFLREERKELENRRGTLLYDASSWNLPMNFGLDACWAKAMSDVGIDAEPQRAARDAGPLEAARYGYLIDFQSADAYRVLVRLFGSACHPRIAIRPFRIGETAFAPGTILLRGHENPSDVADLLRQATTDLDVAVRAVDTALVEEGPDLGSGKFELLTAPRVAIASQWPVRSTSFGSVWYLLDHELRLRNSPINVQDLGSVDLRKYNVLILPDSGGLERVLSDGTVEKIKRWVQSGGTLIAIGGSAVFATAKERGLSSVRLRRDVLNQLDEYAEAVARERSAQDVQIDPNRIWQAPQAKETTKDEAKATDEAKKKEDIETLKRADEWQRLFSPTGTFVLGLVHPEHWLGYGLGEKLPVMFLGSSVFLSKHPAATPVRLAEAGRLRLGGLLWPEARERLADSAYVTVESSGGGQVILFATDPTFRMWLAGQQRLLLNAVLLGPGLGASPAVPW